MQGLHNFFLNMRNHPRSMSEELYIVEEKLPLDAYNVRIDAYHLAEKIKTANEAGVKMDFYAYIPALEKRKEDAVIRKFELDDPSNLDQPVPQKAIEKIMEIDGIYRVSNQKTSDGKVKYVEQAENSHSSGGGTIMRELDESWEVFLDPVTADVLGVRPIRESMKELTAKDYPSTGVKLLEAINTARYNVGLTLENIGFRRDERRDKRKLR